MDNWVFVPIKISKRDEIKIISMLMEVGVLLIMNCHVYEFGGKYHLQTQVGSIGLAITLRLANIVMKAFDSLWPKVAKDDNINIWLNRRYVDDMRNMLSGIEKGWRWSKHESCFV